MTSTNKVTVSSLDRKIVDLLISNCDGTKFHVGEDCTDMIFLISVCGSMSFVCVIRKSMRFWVIISQICP